MPEHKFPVQTKFPVVMQTSASPTGVIQVDRCLSAINHRLYRQSRVYNAKVDLDANAQQNTVVTVWALADTWFAQKAYQMAYDEFAKNSAEELAQMKTSRARWHDFRVSHGLSSYSTFLPGGKVDPSGAIVSFGANNSEYIYSEVANTLGATQTFRWSGIGSGTFNIIDEYDQTGSPGSDPSVPSGTNVAYDGLTDEVDDNQMDHLSNHGNIPPYDSQLLENSVWVKVATLVCSHNSTDKLSTGYFKAPCGLIAITKNSPFTLDESVLNVEVKSGDYKGVQAPTYIDLVKE